MTYRLYREHKYVCDQLISLEQQVARADFTRAEEIEAASQTLKAFEQLLKGHAHYEESALHELLRQKDSTIHHTIEADHQSHDEQFAALLGKLDEILKAPRNEDKIELGHQFYLEVRLFHSDLLKHFHEEETKIMPKLQSLYSKEELKGIEKASYAKMTSEQMINMMTAIFPHMNANDLEFFITDIKNAEPEKFKVAWQDIKNLLNDTEQKRLAEMLKI